MAARLRAVRSVGVGQPDVKRGIVAGRDRAMEAVAWVEDRLNR